MDFLKVGGTHAGRIVRCINRMRGRAHITKQAHLHRACLQDQRAAAISGQRSRPNISNPRPSEFSHRIIQPLDAVVRDVIVSEAHDQRATIKGGQEVICLRFETDFSWCPLSRAGNWRFEGENDMALKLGCAGKWVWQPDIAGKVNLLIGLCLLPGPSGAPESPSRPRDQG